MDWPRLEDDGPWDRWRRHWRLQPGVTFLDHGSKGPPPRAVMAAWMGWIRRIDANPRQFYARTGDGHMQSARQRLADFVGCDADDLAFMINTTMGMHAIAASFPLRAGDEVLLSNHAYGVVRRTWQRACDRAGAKLVIQRLSWPFVSAGQVVEEYFAGVTPRTRLAVFDHVTSPTGAILPVEALCRRGRELGLVVCVDGAHAPGMLPLEISKLDCDFYAASCHKWLCAAAGSGFLYAHPRAQGLIEPLVVDWSVSWRDVWWCGTRDFTPFLSVPAAIDFLERAGLAAFRRRTHALARYARERIGEMTGLEPLVSDSPDWYGSMASLPLPPGDTAALHEALWTRHGIEVSLGPWEDRNLIRVSCHLYNTPEDIDRLVEALRENQGR